MRVRLSVLLAVVFVVVSGAFFGVLVGQPTHDHMVRVPWGHFLVVSGIALAALGLAGLTALAAAGLAALPLDTADDAGAASADDGMTVAQAIELVVNNSAAVLTSAPEHQAEWLETLQQWQAGAQAQGLDEFATFCGLLRELVAGADAAGLAARVPEPMRAAWEELLGRLGGAALPGATPAA